VIAALPAPLRGVDVPGGDRRSNALALRDRLMPLSRAARLCDGSGRAPLATATTTRSRGVSRLKKELAQIPVGSPGSHQQSVRKALGTPGLRGDRVQMEQEEPMDVNNLKRESRTRKSSPPAPFACAVFTASACSVAKQEATGGAGGTASGGASSAGGRAGSSTAGRAVEGGLHRGSSWHGRQQVHR